MNPEKKSKKRFSEVVEHLIRDILVGTIFSIFDLHTNNQFVKR